MRFAALQSALATLNRISAPLSLTLTLTPIFTRISPSIMTCALSLCAEGAGTPGAGREQHPDRGGAQCAGVHHVHHRQAPAGPGGPPALRLGRCASCSLAATACQDQTSTADQTWLNGCKTAEVESMLGRPCTDTPHAFVPFIRSDCLPVETCCMIRQYRTAGGGTAWMP